MSSRTPPLFPQTISSLFEDRQYRKGSYRPSCNLRIKKRFCSMQLLRLYLHFLRQTEAKFHDSVQIV